MTAFVALATQSIGYAQTDWRINGRDQNWPEITYGYTPGFIVQYPDGRVQVQVEGLLGVCIEYGKFFREKMPVPLSLEQARSISSVFEDFSAMSSEAGQILEAARARHDAEALERAQTRMADLAHWRSQELPYVLKRRMSETLEAGQLDQFKSLCINALLQQVGLQGVFTRLEQIADFSMTPEQKEDLAMELLQMEFEMQREIMQLRRRMWDRLMSKLPPETVAAFEADVGIDGLEKPPNR